MSSRLAELARAQRADEDQTPVEEACELCAAPIPPGHKHLLDTDSRELMCACRACALLFDRKAASEGRYKLIGDRRLALEGFELDDATWDALRIPVDMAFFYRHSGAEQVMAYYPSPMGPTESQLELAAWDTIEAANPVLADMAADTEALLVNRTRDARDHWLVPLDECYSLVGLVRATWKGLGGGTEVWREIDDFFARLRRQAKVAGPSPVPAAEEAR
ncbi:MAG: DUF5947 family protein [Solirubrobacterales bacterium]